MPLVQQKNTAGGQEGVQIVTPVGYPPRSYSGEDPPRSKIFLNKFFNPRSGLLRRFDNLSISLLCIAFFVRLCRCGNSLRFHKKEGLHKLFFTSLSLYLWYSGGPPKVAVPLLLSTLVAVLRSQGFIITNLDYHRPLSVLSNKL